MKRLYKQYGAMLLFTCTLTTFVSAQQIAGTNTFKATNVTGLTGAYISTAAQAKLDKAFNHYTLYTLDGASIHSFANSAGNNFDLKIDLGNEYSWDLSLELNDMRSPDHQLMVVTERGIEIFARTKAETYKGYANADGYQMARLSIRDGIIKGYVKQNGIEVFLEPVSHSIPGEREDLYMVYKVTDVVFEEGISCGATEITKAEKLTGISSTNTAVCKLADISLASDYSFFQERGSVANADKEMRDILNLVEGKYMEPSVEISYSLIKTFIVSTSGGDPWSTSNTAQTLLDSFVSWGNGGGFGSTTHDVASLWTNRDLNNSGVIGLAYVGVICGTNRYGIMEHYFNIGSAGNFVDQSHEVGHNWNASHFGSGDNTNIMSPSIGAGNTTWDNTTINSITTHKNSRSCLGASCSKAPTADFTVNTTTSCTGTVQFTDLSTNTPTSWSWDFGDGQTSTQKNPSHTYANGGTYTVKLTATNATGNDVETKTSYITVSKLNPTGTGDTRCGAGVVNLSASASGGGTLSWYTTSTGGSPVATGTTYAPNISSTTTFYVEESTVPAPQKVGPVNNTFGAGGYFTANDARREVFDVLGSCTLKTVKVYANTAGSRRIVWVNSAGVGIDSITVNVPAGESRVTLNFNLTPGTDYGLKLSSAGGNVLDLYRNNAGGASYPYTIAGKVSIKTTDATGTATDFYYYFYDWEIQGSGCTSTRKAVTGTVNVCTGTGTVAETGNLNVFPNPAHTSLDITFKSISGEDVQIELLNSIGEIVYQSAARASGLITKQADLSELPVGIYLLRIRDGEQTVLQKIVKE